MTLDIIISRFLRFENIFSFIINKNSHASLLINLGCDSREVADRLGDTIQIVEKTYFHLFSKKKNHSIELLNKFNESKR